MRLLGDGSVADKHLRWHPIETAPMDRRILLRWASGDVIMGQWDDNRYAKTCRPFWGSDAERWKGLAWHRQNSPVAWMDVIEST